MSRKTRKHPCIRSTTNGLAVLVVITLLLLSVLCASCRRDAPVSPDDVSQKATDATAYESKVLGFSLKFPENWKDRYFVKETEDCVSFYSKRVHDAYPDFGRLFTIGRMVGELVTEEDMEQAPAGQKVLGRRNGYTYFVMFPSDVQCPPADEELRAEYLRMSEQVHGVCDSFSLLPCAEPRAVNRGFRVIGSSFFTVEVPREWEIRASGEIPLRWDIYSGDSEIGSIELVPYGCTEPAAEGWRREYVSSESFRRTARITVDAKHASAGRMKAIRDSFKFTGGPFTVVDLLSNAELYLSLGGTKVFGKIEGFDMRDGELVAVRVRAMRLVEEDAGGEPAGRLLIEDLNEVHTYPLDFGAYIAPLVAPHYQTYGTYEMFPLDEDFIRGHPGFDDFFYDFIVGRDGQLKIVLGHYVPR